MINEKDTYGIKGINTKKIYFKCRLKQTALVRIKRISIEEREEMEIIKLKRWEK